MEKSGQSSHTVAAVHSTPRRPCCVPAHPRKREAEREIHEAVMEGTPAGRAARRGRTGTRSLPRRPEVVTFPGARACARAWCVCVCKLSREAFKVILGPHQTHCTREHLNRRPVPRSRSMWLETGSVGACVGSSRWLKDWANTWYGVPTGSKSMQENLPYKVTRIYMRCCERMPWQAHPHRTYAALEQRCPKMFVVTEVVFTFWRGLD